MSWNYARLSKAAKKAGSPEQYVTNLIDYGRKLGHKEMFSLIGSAAGLLAIGYAGIKLVRYLRKKEKTSEAALAEAKQELIQGIKNYDLEHTEAEDNKSTNENNDTEE